MKFKVRNHIILLDDCDSWILDEYNFNIVKDNKSNYWSVKCVPKNSKGKRIHVTLCYLILDKKEGMIVDHKNRNPLDNRRMNLRFVTHPQNSWNRQKQNNFKGKPTTSIFKGVSYHKHRECWRVRICAHGKTTYLGEHETEVEAAKVYDRHAKELFGQFAVLNFPVKKKKLVKRI